MMEVQFYTQEKLRQVEEARAADRRRLLLEIRSHRFHRSTVLRLLAPDLQAFGAWVEHLGDKSKDADCPECPPPALAGSVE
jgi:hypothetical protein